ncbi:hypothetical protein JNB88_18370 [Rhizobium cauense]|uniref:hypothetical protein n=1 Tax=Rhizobium cauense TaxID=1166683 RepID=UPI001C6F4D3B|nr:hypothetical protein [Rhizobium cauense]MBW9115605.1 hypothetical protein [Rhizobium cauense]
MQWEIVLPYAPGSAGSTHSTPKQVSAGTVSKVELRDPRGHSIVVIEDEPLIGIGMVAALEDAGAEVPGPWCRLRMHAV